MPIILNISTALLLGVLIGFERELRNHEAGLRTNALVSLGAALFISLAQMLGPDDGVARIAAQVVSGIGFLAGGVIIRDGFSVRGLNTAATLWCTAAVGTLAGAGLLTLSCVGAAGVIALHTMLRPATNRLDNWVRKHAHTTADYRIRMTVSSTRSIEMRQEILNTANNLEGVSCHSLTTSNADRPNEILLTADLVAIAADDAVIESMILKLAKNEGITSAGWERRNGRPVS
ncbi:MAG: MgtC/SapB family protein [Gemmataceae bacterium]